MSQILFYKLINRFETGSYSLHKLFTFSMFTASRFINCKSYNSGDYSFMSHMQRLLYFCVKDFVNLIDY